MNFAASPRMCNWLAKVLMLLTAPAALAFPSLLLNQMNNNNSGLGQHRIFSISVEYNGASVGGLSGADAKCQNAATTAGLGGTWKAVMSDSTIDVRDRLVISGPVRNLRPAGSGGPQTLATNAADFWDGTLAFPVGYMEDGGAATSPSAWTGSNADGTKNANTCTNWTSSSGNGIRGRTDNAATSIFDASLTCGITRSFYCMDQ